MPNKEPGRFAVTALLAGAMTLVRPGCGDDDDTSAESANPTIRSILLVAMTPNPNGGFDALYALAGDFSGTGEFVIAAEAGSQMPACRLEVGNTAVLRIFHFNDMHHHLVDFSATRGDTHRLSQMVKRVKTARSTATAKESVLWFSAGDDHIGNVFDELLGFDTASFQMSAAYHAYNAAGLDATVIGNHELDKGAALLARAVAQDAPHLPVLSANLNGSQFLGDSHISPAVVGVTPNGIRVGIMGLTTRRETLLRTDSDPGLEADDILTTVERVLPILNELSDVIVILSHVGYNGEIDGMVRHELDVGDIDIAARAGAITDKPVVLIGGHTHSLMNTQGPTPEHSTNGVPIVQVGANGSHLGEIEWTVSRTESSVTATIATQVHTVKRRDDRIAPTDPNYPTLEHDEDLDDTFDRNVMEPILAALAGRLSETLGVAEANPDLSTATTIAGRYSGEIAIANFMNDSVVAASEHFPQGRHGTSQAVDIAVFNATAINAGIAPGAAITFNDWFAVMPYADTVVLATMTGAEIKQMVISNAKRILRPDETIDNGGDYDPAAFVSRGFLHFSAGLRYTVKLGDNVGETTAVDITLLDQPIDTVLDQSFTVAINRYLANGSEGWHGGPIAAGLPDDTPAGPDLTALPLNETYLVYRNEILAFIRSTQSDSSATGAVLDGRVKVAD